MHNSLSYANAGDALTKICRFCLNMSQANDGATELVPNISQTELANLSACIGARCCVPFRN